MVVTMKGKKCNYFWCHYTPIMLDGPHSARLPAKEPNASGSREDCYSRFDRVRPQDQLRRILANQLYIKVGKEEQEDGLA